MICVKFTAFGDLRADLQIRLTTLRKSVRKFWFCKLALTCESVWPGLYKIRDSCMTDSTVYTPDLQISLNVAFLTKQTYSYFRTYLEQRPVLEPYQSSWAHSFLIKATFFRSASPLSISSLNRRRSSL